VGFSPERNTPVINVRSISDVIFIDETDPTLLSDTPWLQRCEMDFDALKERGNDYFVSNSNEEALKWYN
jgi:hypothetical protein